MLFSFENDLVYFMYYLAKVPNDFFPELTNCTPLSIVKTVVFLLLWLNIVELKQIMKIAHRLSIFFQKTT